MRDKNASVNECRKTSSSVRVTASSTQALPICNVLTLQESQLLDDKIPGTVAFDDAVLKEKPSLALVKLI